MSNKIKDYDGIVATTRALRQEGRTIVHCHGVYDLLHVGHIKHLEAAKRLGDLLIVTITPDRFVNKGPHRPAFGEALRAEALAALGCVDYVAVNRYPTAVELIADLRPDFFVKGAVPGNGQRDHSDAVGHEEAAVVAAGGRFVLTDEGVFSSSTLINRFLDVFTPEAKSFLASFRTRYSPEDVVEHIKAIRGLKVLTIGETIVDEYVFCDAMGRTSKEAVLVVGQNYAESYAGGILAVANHISGFCDTVTVASALGERESLEDLVNAGLRPGIHRHFVTIPGTPTMVKRRYVEEYLGRKLFEVYNTKATPLMGGAEDRLLDELDALLPAHDVVIVADYGHGFLTEKVITRICEKARFLAVNTQTNAGNMGYNVISKYPRADFVAIAEPEVRLERRNHSADVDDLVAQTAQALQCPRMIVTRGKNGCVCYDVQHGLVKVPAFSVKIVDRVGSGDALLALAAPAAALGFPMELVGFIGDVAGAEACAIMGNKSSIEPMSLFRHITSLMM
ncbi:MAG: PfkB family carbohydrate kinase [Vicinamibacterales bacterium]|nr:PfkB family carbohydrate kinase [Vicinamibacterales bacterium]